MISTLALICAGKDPAAQSDAPAQDAFMVSHQDVDRLHRALQKTARRVLLLDRPEALYEAARAHRNLAVFDHWSGEHGRVNTLCYAAAACETLGLPYVGADPYTKLVTQDKSLSKHLLATAGFFCPRSVFAPKRKKTPIISHLRPPLVVKPNSLGGSLYVDENALCGSHREASKRARYLVEEIGVDAVIEEFVNGPEASICAVGPPRRLAAALVKRGPPDGEGFYEGRLLGESDSHRRLAPLRIALARRSVLRPYLRPLAALASLLEKCDFLRVDGRIAEGVFVAIEITADPGLGEGDTFPQAFTSAGMAYDRLIELLVETGIGVRTGRDASAPAYADGPD